MPAEEAERQAKERQLVDRIKAETGFRGTINFDLDASVIEEMWGTFPNCEVRDTVEAQSQALLLISNLLPYIRVDINQLSLKSMRTDDMGIKVSFNQKIDNLKMEPHSGITVVFRTKNFIEVNIISSLIPDLHFVKSKYLTYEEALRIFDKKIGNDYKQRFKDELLISRNYSPEFQHIRRPEHYKVCWRMPYSVGPSGEAHILYIDAVTGEILGHIKPVPFDDISY